MEGCGGDEEGEKDEWLCGPCARLSLSEALVAPDPLLILGALSLIIFGGTGGALPECSPPHSFPRSAAWANTFLRDFLLISNCRRAVSWSVSLVLNLNESHSHGYV
jgi:hypothetical protein